jgi:hypothetical protein
MVIRQQDAERYKEKKVFVINPVIQNIKIAADKSFRELLK